MHYTIIFLYDCNHVAYIALVLHNTAIVLHDTPVVPSKTAVMLYNTLVIIDITAVLLPKFAAVSHYSKAA